jgi:hypothetical protein
MISWTPILLIVFSILLIGSVVGVVYYVKNKQRNIQTQPGRLLEKIKKANENQIKNIAVNTPTTQDIKIENDKQIKEVVDAIKTEDKPITTKEAENIITVLKSENDKQIKEVIDIIKTEEDPAKKVELTNTLNVIKKANDDQIKTLSKVIVSINKIAFEKEKEKEKEQEKTFNTTNDPEQEKTFNTTNDPEQEKTFNTTNDPEQEKTFNTNFGLINKEKTFNTNFGLIKKEKIFDTKNDPNNIKSINDIIKIEKNNEPKKAIVPGFLKKLQNKTKK